jgi:hypothetical protein
MAKPAVKDPPRDEDETTNPVERVEADAKPVERKKPTPESAKLPPRPAFGAAYLAREGSKIRLWMVLGFLGMAVLSLIAYIVFT